MLTTFEQLMSAFREMVRDQIADQKKGGSPGWKVAKRDSDIESCKRLFKMTNEEYAVIRQEVEDDLIVEAKPSV